MILSFFCALVRRDSNIAPVLLAQHRFASTNDWKQLGKKGLGCHADHQEISRSCTRGESEESIEIRQWSTQVRGSTWIMKSRANVTRSQNRGTSALPPPTNDWCPPPEKNFNTICRWWLCSVLKLYWGRVSASCKKEASIYWLCLPPSSLIQQKIVHKHFLP